MEENGGDAVEFDGQSVGMFWADGTDIVHYCVLGNLVSRSEFHDWLKEQESDIQDHLWPMFYSVFN